MAIDFPTSPTNGQTFVASGIAYTYDGTKWTAAASGGSVLGQGDSTAAVIDTGSDGRFVVTTEGSERLRVSEQGRVGIGTAPSYKLDVYEASASGVDFRLRNTEGEFMIRVNDDAAIQQANTLIFRNSAEAERARIDSSGRLLVGTNTGSAKLTVAGNAVGVVTALADSATITPDFSLSNNWSLSLGGNRTLANPTNLTAGQTGVIVITNGAYTLAFGGYWKFPGGTAPTLTQNGTDVLAYYVDSSTRITARLIADVK